MYAVDRWVSRSDDGLDGDRCGARTRGFIKRDFFVKGEGRPIWVRLVLPRHRPVIGCVLGVHGNTFPSIADFDLAVKEESFAEALARRGVACCLFDQRGYGRSYKPVKAVELGIEARARDLEAVVDHLVVEQGIRRVSCVGVSTGCVTIAEFLRNRNPNVASLIFLGPSYLANPLMMKLVRMTKLLRTLRRIVGDGENLYMSFSEASLRKRLSRGEGGMISMTAVDRFIAASIDATNPGSSHLRSPVLGFIDMKRRYRTGDRLFEASVIEIPLMIVRGERDDFCCGVSAAELHRQMARKEVSLTTIPGVKHDLHLYPEPDGVFDEMFEFIVRTQRHDSTS